MLIKSSFPKEIIGVFVIKMAIILIAGFTIFGAAQRIHVDPAMMTSLIFSPH